ncbi:MAG: putative addiction module antidote protein [Hyphomicrobiaceae bacterium]|nr:putative addiction module antidote protein [Hyphomicrobiaceae bacterium]
MTKKATPALKDRPGYRVFDIADHLRDEDDVAAYLEVAAEAGDAEHFARALGNVARARSLSGLARSTGISRQGLQKALSERGNPSLATTMTVLNSLGLRMAIVAQSAPVRKKKPAAKPKSRSIG